MNRWLMKKTGWSRLIAVTLIASSDLGARADTSPQELLAMVPADAAVVVIVPNLKYCSDEITRCLEGMDRANLLLGTRPLDQLKSISGFNVGINDVGGAALVVLTLNEKAPPTTVMLMPVSDGESFLKGNFQAHIKDDEYFSARGKAYHARIVGGYAVVSERAEAVTAVAASVAKPDDHSPWQNLGEQAAKVLGNGDLIIVTTRDGVRPWFDLAAASNPMAGDEQAVQRVRKIISPMIEDLRIGIMALNFDPLGLIAGTLAMYQPDSAMAKQLAGGKGSDAAPLTRLPNKPGYFAASIDVQGLGGSEAMRQLCTMLTVPTLPDWLTQTGGFQFAAYPSPAGLAGGFLNDAVAILQTATPPQAREALKSGLLSFKDQSHGIKFEVLWADDKPVKNASSPLNADHYEVKIIDVPPEQAMVQTIAPLVFGRAGWRGFVKSTDDALLMTFSQRPAVLEAALNVRPDSSYGSTGVIKTMHKWMPAHNDIEVYIGIGQLAQMAIRIAQSLGANDAAGIPEFEPNAPPIGLAVEVDQGTVSSTVVIPAAILAPLLDQWIGTMKNRAANDDAPPPESPATSGERQ